MLHKYSNVQFTAVLHIDEQIKCYLPMLYAYMIHFQNFHIIIYPDYSTLRANLSSELRTQLVSFPL